MQRLGDGLASLAAALAALLVCGLPGAIAALALGGATIPAWARSPGWIATILLMLACLILTAAFLRKAVRGIAPSRDRARMR